MLNKNNAHFEEMHRIGCEWEKARADHQAIKEETIETYGWDSEEVKAWYAKKEAMKFPFDGGESKAYRAWAGSIAKEEDEVEMEDFLWDREVKGFVDTLHKAGIETFVYTNTSTAVMENLHAFAAEGCKMTGLCTITRHESRWGTEEANEVQGIRFEVC